MPVRGTKFSISWLEKSDKNGVIIRDWCEQCTDDPSCAFCKVCKKKFSIANMGFAQIQSHSSGSKHKDLMKSRNNQCTFVLIKKSAPTGETPKLELSGPSSCRHWIPSNLKERVIKAEILAILTAIKCNISFASIQCLAEMFPAAFDDSNVAKNVKLSETKARYVVKFGLAPYFRKQILSDLLSSSSFICLYFDETTTKQTKKQLDFYLSFWSSKEEKVVTAYCESYFLGHAEAGKIFDIILSFLSDNNIPVDKLLQFSMDGPNTNLLVKKKIDSHLASLKFPPLIDVGTCTLHQMHTALKKGLNELNCDVETFALNIYSWFKMSPARREDFHSVQVEVLVEAASNHVFQRHVESRWLSLGAVCERLLEQYPALKEYFLSIVPKSKIKINDKCIKISEFLKNPKSLIYLHFVNFLCNVFVPYLSLFQKESPLIHVLYSKLNELVRNIMFKFLKQEAVGQKEGIALININCNDSALWLPLKKMDVGTGAKQLINFAEHKDVLHNIRHIYIEICEYLTKKLPLSNVLLQDLQYISPDLQKSPKAKDAMSRLVITLSKVTKTDFVRDQIKSEFQLYTVEDLSVVHSSYQHDKNICKFWAEVAKMKDLAGNEKYSYLCKFIKTCLTISHGNSVPERGFSMNNMIVTKDKNSLSELGIKSLRLCKDFMKDRSASSIPITKNMVECVEKAYAEYSAYLEQIKNEKIKESMKRQAEIQEKEETILKKRKIDALNDEMNDLIKKENTYYEDEKIAHSLLNEASEKLNEGIKSNSSHSIKMAQMMLETANTNMKKINEELNLIRLRKAEIEKKINSK